MERGRRWTGLVIAFGLLAACASGSSDSSNIAPPGQPPVSAGSQPQTAGNRASIGSEPAGRIGPGAAESRIVVGQAGVAFDRRLLGTNLPAWVGPTMLKNPAFQTATLASGASVIRMPGGSWADSYDWLACENGEAEHCYWTWAARPTDYLQFLRSTHLAGMWTTSLNGTAQEAAALVAFFNGTVDDGRPIGTDRNGRDWKTVGDWAQLRAAHGNPEPLRIAYWEVGNETYGAKPSAGSECASFGWEDVWTCDGSAYVEGDSGHDGYLAFRAAMRAVDPTIKVGAVGTANTSDWSDWGDKVIEAAGPSLDFYVVHQYGFDKSPGASDAFASPASTWPAIVPRLAAALTRSAPGAPTPIAVTEYNLVSFQDGDTERAMTRAMNALYLADSIGQMGEQGVLMANQWNLINGKAGNGTDYGMLDADTLRRSPQFYALRLWSGFGDRWAATTASGDGATNLHVYGSRSSSSAVVLVINPTASAIETTIDAFPAGTRFRTTIDEMSAATTDDQAVTYNGSEDASNDLADHPAQAISTMTGSLRFAFNRYSITLITMTLA